MTVFYDQLKREVYLTGTPKQIISLVPSQTELLFYLGLDDEITGITKFCIHPADKVVSKTKIGGTKQLNIALIRALNPDLIIANKEENNREQVEALMAFCPVWISDIQNLHESLQMIRQVGQITGKPEEAINLSNAIAERFKRLAVSASGLSVAYLIWRKPYMAAGRGTFIDDMLQRCGWLNAFDAERYPEISPEMLISANPAIVLLSSEPYPFKEKHIAEIRALLPYASIQLVDGELFSWYGSRLLHAPDYFKQLAEQTIKTKTSNQF